MRIKAARRLQVLPECGRRSVLQPLSVPTVYQSNGPGAGASLKDSKDTNAVVKSVLWRFRW